MPANKLRPPYRERILAYCAKHGISVPPGFHVRNAEKFAIFDITSEPNALVSVTTYLPSDVISFITDKRNEGRRFRILDFKRGCELLVEGNIRLVRGDSFQCKSENELLYLVTP